VALIHLDAGVLIGFLDSHDSHHDGSRVVIADALRDGDDLAMAASALAETLVGPARAGSGAVVRVHDLVAELPITIVTTLNLDIATRAASSERATDAFACPTRSSSRPPSTKARTASSRPTTDGPPTSHSVFQVPSPTRDGGEGAA
jgi:hypothetical protein